MITENRTNLNYTNSTKNNPKTDDCREGEPLLMFGFQLKSNTEGALTSHRSMLFLVLFILLLAFAPTESLLSRVVEAILIALG